VLPDVKRLGAGWQGKLLLGGSPDDPTAGSDTSGLIGSSYSKFQFEGSRSYFVRVEHHIHAELADREFSRLSSAASDGLRLIPVPDLGDRAAMAVGANQQVTLWLQRDAFVVGIETNGGANAWDDDAALRQLAAALDEKILQVSQAPR
jgi:hypothetical protein